MYHNNEGDDVNDSNDNEKDSTYRHKATILQRRGWDITG